MPVIYKITSPSNKIYIGQSWDWIKRKSVYKRLACPKQLHLYNSLLKYGYDNHKIEVIDKFPEDITQEELDNKEIEYCKIYKDQGFKLLNIREAGRGGKLSKETIEKMKASLKGRVISKESTRKMLETKKQNGFVLSKESRKKIGDKHKGKIISLEQRMQISKKLTGRKIPKEVLEKIALTKKLNPHPCSEETKKKISETHKGRPLLKCRGGLAWQAKKVIDISNGTIYGCIKEAAICNNISISNLQNRLNKKVSNNTNLRLLTECVTYNEEVSQK